MVPKNIGKEHIVRAIKKIKRSEVPKSRRSRKFLLEI